MVAATPAAAATLWCWAFVQVHNPFNTFCSVTSFMFTAGGFYGSFEAFHVEIWIILYPVLMLLFGLPFRFYGSFVRRLCLNRI